MLSMASNGSRSSVSDAESDNELTNGSKSCNSADQSGNDGERENHKDLLSDDDTRMPKRSTPTSSSLVSPTSVMIVTNISDIVFGSTDAKASFELLFTKYDEGAKFQYLKTFHRARICFSSIEAATDARLNLDKHVLFGQHMRCYFAECPIDGPISDDRNHLKPPPPTKQFLISPPSSPPVDWEVIAERTPAINYDLINAIAAMGPGTAYEMHAATDTQPAIIVHICDDPEGYDNRPSKIEQTKRPTSNIPSTHATGRSPKAESLNPT